MDETLAAAVTQERRRARRTIWLLYAGLGANVIAIASDASRWVALSGSTAGDQLPQQQIEEYGGQHGAIAALRVLTFIPTVILWLVWLYRAYANLGLVGSKRSRFTQGWAVGYWFIPFLNLVRPYQITADLWIRSDTGNAADAVAGRRAPALIGWWWLAYLASSFAERWYYSLAENPVSVTEELAATVSGLVAVSIGVVAALLAIAVVRGIDKRQQAFQGEVAPGAAPGA